MPRWKVHFDMSVQSGPEIVTCLAQAKALASVIRGIPIPPYVQDRLDRLNILRAVRGTTGIEGTELSATEVEQIVDAGKGRHVLPEGRHREEQEVKNAQRLMYHIAEIMSQGRSAPVTEELVCSFHKIITDKIEYPNNIPGRYRTFQVHAGDYLPPDGSEVRPLMRRFIEWFNEGSARKWDPIVRAIAAHFFLVSIHPFGDGNGRASRGVESYLLYQAGLTARGFYSLSNFYYRERHSYTSMLDRVRFRSDPDLTPFVRFALLGLVQELQTVHDEVLAQMRIISFRDYARETLSGAGKLGTPIGKRLLFFLLDLEDEPVSIKALRTGSHRLSGLYKGVTTKTLMRDINFLKQRKLIVVKGDDLHANMDIMIQFTALNAPSPKPIIAT